MTSMNRAEIVLAALRKIGEIEDSAEIKLSDRIGDDLQIDSLARIDVVVRIEKQTGVSFDEAMLVDVVTVGDLIALTDRTCASLK